MSQQKIPQPNYTQTPNIFFDEVFKLLKEGELRVLLVLARQTFGWHKSADRVSLSQLATKTGMERSRVCKSLGSLIEKGLVQKFKFGEKGKERCYYTLVVETPEQEKVDPTDGVETEEEMALISNISYQCPKDTGVVSLGHQTSVFRTPTKETPKENVQNKQQQRARPSGSSPPSLAETAAASSKTKQKDVVVYSSLKTVDISEKDKIEICSMYKEDQVSHAVSWCFHPLTKINKGVVPALKWACKTKPDLPKSADERSLLNRKYALKYDEVKNGQNYVMALSSCVEIVYPGSPKSFVLNYDENGFVDQFQNALRKSGFKILME